MRNFITAWDLWISTAIFCCISIPISLADCKTKKIPNILNYAGIVLFLVYRLIFFYHQIIFYMVSALAAGAVLYITRLISGKKLGMGDVKYGITCSLYAGLINIFPGILFSCLFCGIFFAILKAWHKSIRSLQVPFGPFMAAGTLCANLISSAI